ncbi:MAG: hypothetical protein ABF333_14515 [Akkermansiaceae bacterium]
MKTLAFIAGMKSARRRFADPILVMGVVDLPEVPLTKRQGVDSGPSRELSRTLKK